MRWKKPVFSLLDRNQLMLLSLVFGVFLSSFFIAIQPIEFEKFHIELDTAPLSHSVWYDDLEGDGRKEKFVMNNDRGKHLALFVYDDEGATYDQANFDYPIVVARTKELPISANVSGDSTKEIFLFTQKKDSLYLNVFSYNESKVLRSNIPVSKIGRDNGKLDIILKKVGTYDADGDSYDEIYFFVTGGFALYPRRVFRYNYQKNELISSINTGAGITHGEIFPDQSNAQILVSSAAYGNTRIDYPYEYHDTCCWILGFDKDLQLNIKPRSYGAYPSQTHGFHKAGSKYHFLFSQNNKGGTLSTLYEIDLFGNPIRSNDFPGDFTNRLFQVPYKNDVLSFVYKAGEQYYKSIDFKELTTNRISPLRDLEKVYFKSYDDIDKDGIEEYFFVEFNKNRLVMYSGDFKNPIFLPYESGSVPEFISSKYNHEKKSGDISFVTTNRNFVYKFNKNPYYHFKYPLWVFIYLVSSGFLYLLLGVQQGINRKRRRMEEEIANLQLQNLRNQLDPHFTFNALNSVGNAIYKEDKEKAYDLFQRFTRMIRSSLLVSDKVFRTLGEELQFTKDYLEFQKTRFKQRFDYSFNVDADINVEDIEVPKMLIQSFAENAVKHAFYQIDYLGHIEIRVHRIKSEYQITVEDNGIGINKSKELQSTSGTQKGENIISNQIKNINSLYRKDLHLSIQDKSDFDIEITGTKVLIVVR